MANDATAKPNISQRLSSEAAVKRKTELLRKQRKLRRLDEKVRLESPYWFVILYCSKHGNYIFYNYIEESREARLVLYIYNIHIYCAYYSIHLQGRILS